MKTTTYKRIASDTSWLRILHIISTDKENETITYCRLGIQKTISGEKLYRLLHLIDCNKYSKDRGRMAMSMKHKATNKKYVIIDKAFINEF